MDELLTVTEVAEQLNCPQVTIRYWIRTGQIEAVTLPARGKYPHYRIKKTVVAAIEQRMKHHLVGGKVSSEPANRKPEKWQTIL